MIKRQFRFFRDELFLGGTMIKFYLIVTKVILIPTVLFLFVGFLALSRTSFDFQNIVSLGDQAPVLDATPSLPAQFCPSGETMIKLDDTSHISCMPVKFPYNCSQIRAGSNLSGCDLQRKDLQYKNLSETVLEDALLIDTNLDNANLTRAILSNTNLSNTRLAGANLSGADLKNTSFDGNLTLIRTNFSKANLKFADLSGTNLSNAILLGANLTDANLLNADLTGADVLGVTWGNTICPNGTNSNAHPTGDCIGQGGGL